MTYCCVRLERKKGRHCGPLSHYPTIHTMHSSHLFSCLRFSFRFRTIGLSRWCHQLSVRDPIDQHGDGVWFVDFSPMMLEFVNNVENTRMLESHPDGEDTDRTGICPSLQYYYAHPSVLLTCLPSLAWNTEESQPGLRSHALRLRRWCISGYLPPVGFPTENHQLTRSTNHRADDRVMPRTDGWA
jgi:hypothetical protein